MHESQPADDSNKEQDINDDNQFHNDQNRCTGTDDNELSWDNSPEQFETSFSQKDKT